MTSSCDLAGLLLAAGTLTGLFALLSAGGSLGHLPLAELVTSSCDLAGLLLAAGTLTGLLALLGAGSSLGYLPLAELVAGGGNNFSLSLTATRNSTGIGFYAILSAGRILSNLTLIPYMVANRLINGDGATGNAHGDVFVVCVSQRTGFKGGRNIVGFASLCTIQNFKGCNE